MAFYTFVTEQGQQIIKSFPMGQCPKQIQTQDGKKAKRKLGFGNIQWGSGVMTPTVAQKKRKMMTQKNIASGKRGQQYWRSKNPKLVSE